MGKGVGPDIPAKCGFWQINIPIAYPLSGPLGTGFRMSEFSGL